MSATDQNVPLSQLNATQLRGRLYELVEISDFDALETRFNTLNSLLKQKETASPRSQFWDTPRIIPRNLASTYSCIHAGEIPGAIFMALGLNRFGGPQDSETTTMDPSDSKPLLPLGRFFLASFPNHLSNMCKHFFGPATTGLRFILKCKPAAAAESSVASTEVTRMLDAREQIHDKIVRIDEVREKLVVASKQAMPRLRAVLKEDMETRADSDHDSDDDENDDSDDPDADPDSDEEIQPSKRRKCYEDMGTGKDTEVQKIRLDGITVSPASGVVSMRAREFRGEAEPHFIELMGAIACDDNFKNRLPNPRAPAYSHGAELDHSHKLVHPGTDVTSGTVVTQKMMDTDNSLVGTYNEMHEMAYTMRRGLLDLARVTRNAFHFVIRVETTGAHTDHTIESLTDMQKFVIGQLYLSSISIRRDAAEEEPEEESEEEEESSDEEGDSGGSEYLGSDSDEDEDEEDDSGSEYVGSDGEEDGE